MKYQNIPTAEFETLLPKVAPRIYKQYKYADMSLQRACEYVFNQEGFTVAKASSLESNSPCLNETRRAKLYTAINQHLGYDEFVPRARTMKTTQTRKVKYNRPTTQKQEMIQAIDSRIDKRVADISRLQKEIRVLKKQRTVVKTMQEVL